MDVAIVIRDSLVDLTAISGLELHLAPSRLELLFGAGVVHPPGERRLLDDVRANLRIPNASGPEHLYTIYMDIFDREDRAALQAQKLLYGAVVYNHGTIGDERLRSQGHVHSIDPKSRLRFSEVYEFWTGRGYVYMQKEAAAVVTRALLIPVKAGDKVVVPLGWMHLTIADGDDVLSFGAWCARENNLEYAEVRRLGGPAHFLLSNGDIVKNPRYRRVAEVETLLPSQLPLLGIPAEEPIYRSWRSNPECFDFLPSPILARGVWCDL
jgi:glucose-6-phosphate isomerase